MQTTNQKMQEERVTDLEEAAIAGDSSPGLAASHALVYYAAQGVHIHPASTTTTHHLGITMSLKRKEKKSLRLAAIIAGASR